MSSEVGVVKLGSSLLENAEGVDVDAIDHYAAGLTATYGSDGLIVVTSGAVAAGRHRAEKFYGSEVNLSDQKLAALGEAAIFHAWEQAFEKQDVLAASVGVTHRQMSGNNFWQNLFNREEKRTFAQLLSDNAESGIVTVVNEADAISVTELMQLIYGGDNDGLASHLARAIGARSLTLFTKKGGVFDDEGRLIELVDRANIQEVKKLAKLREAGDSGRGGLPTKVAAAWEAAKRGIDVRIAAVNHDMTGDLVTKFVVR